MKLLQHLTSLVNQQLACDLHDMRIMNKIIVKSRRETELMPAYSRPWACISITDTSLVIGAPSNVRLSRRT